MSLSCVQKKKITHFLLKIGILWASLLATIPLFTSRDDRIGNDNVSLVSIHLKTTTPSNASAVGLGQSWL